ncbi:TetR/AcrR family transcriptional regulator [Citricoccus sp. SGAir0253]|uniref:TetR/AcrR family transcriptional regulator n=1 Tax=Citricoccus sp. SGAir0253 TaxID=2567881 RepID=UPI001FF02CAF|nr:TetR/AcrR family transcriptional regulator [Citricoccus sp. SGAir0253]
MAIEPLHPDTDAPGPEEVPTTTKGTTLTARGLRTRRRLLDAAETVFAGLGYPAASIVKITEEAGCGLGTFYLYFEGKQEIFNEVVLDLNRRVRRAMADAARAEAPAGRIAAERAGFRAFFRFTAEHPALYRIIRQAEFASPDALRLHYARIVDGYAQGLEQGQRAGEVHRMDPEVVAWALMGIGEIIGMRWVLWPQEGDGAPGEGGAGTTGDVPDHVFDTMMEFIERALAPSAADREGADHDRDTAGH